MIATSSSYDSIASSAVILLSLDCIVIGFLTIVLSHQTLLQECQMRKEQEESQDHLLSKLTSRNQMLEAELKRLADIVEASASGKRVS